MEKVIKLVEEITYIANDGTEFDRKDDCLMYEWKEQAKKVYIPLDKRMNTHHKHKQGYDKNVEIYSSEETCNKAISTYALPDDWYCQEIYLDHRLWKD